MCNVLYNYLMVGFVYSILWLFLIKPIVIILNVILLIVVSVTAIVWIPIVLTAHYFFNLLFYNFDLD